jgi:hypothetical protein
MLHARTTGWRSQQRHRITHLSHHPEGTRQVLVEGTDFFGQPQTEVRTYEAKDLVDRFFNISLIGETGKPYFVSPPSLHSLKSR